MCAVHAFGGMLLGHTSSPLLEQLITVFIYSVYVNRVDRHLRMVHTSPHKQCAVALDGNHSQFSWPLGFRIPIGDAQLFKCALMRLT